MDYVHERLQREALDATFDYYDRLLRNYLVVFYVYMSVASIIFLTFLCFGYS